MNESNELRNQDETKPSSKEEGMCKKSDEDFARKTDADGERHRRGLIMMRMATFIIEIVRFQHRLLTVGRYVADMCLSLSGTSITKGRNRAASPSALADPKRPGWPHQTRFSNRADSAQSIRRISQPSAPWQASFPDPR